MEGKGKWKKARFSTILWAVIGILLFCVPGFAEEVPPGGEPLDLDYAIMGDWLSVYGTLNMNSGAYVDWGVYAYPGKEIDTLGATVNIWLCHREYTMGLR